MKRAGDFDWPESVTEKETGNAQSGACVDVLPRCSARRTFLPCSAPNLQEEFSSCRSYPITKGFTSIRRQSYPITPHEMWLKPFWWYPDFVLSPVFKYKALVGVLSSLPRSNFPGSLGARKHYRLVLDCKTVGFFSSKSVKKSVKRGVRVVRARPEKNRQSVFLVSLPSLALCFQPRSRPFVWLLART